LDEQKELYTFLDKRRRDLFGQRAQERREAVEKATSSHQGTLAFQKQLCAGGPQDALLEFLNSMIQPPSLAGALHIVFCLDESGSMGGAPWNQLMAAYHSFLKMRLKQGAQDVITVVPFSSTARVAQGVEAVSLEKALATVIEFKSGGTCFAPALALAKQVLQKHPQKPGLLVFMSDGSNGDSMADVLKQLHELPKNMQCHTVFFGNPQADAGAVKNLTAMADAAGGLMHISVDGIKLKEKFEEIASGGVTQF
jgi:uncharacterized protein YegL